MGGKPSQEFDYEKHDRLVEGLYIGVRTRLSRVPARQMELIDGRHVTAMPTSEIAKAIIEAETMEEGMAVGLWAELQPEGFNRSDVSVDNRDIVAAGQKRLFARRAELMDRLCKRLNLDGGYAELKEDEKQVFLEANFVRLLSEFAHSFSDRVDALEQELKICKGTK